MFYAGEGQCDTFSLRTGADGKLTELPTATRTDYNFLGWYTEGGTQITTETVFTGDAVAAAKWAADVCTVTITGSGATTLLGNTTKYAWLVIDGEEITSATTKTVPWGTEIKCYAIASPDNDYTEAYIKLNGETVKHESTIYSDSTILYIYTTTTGKNVSIDLSAGRYTQRTVDITETET